MREGLPIFSLPLSPLALFSPSFSNKFLDVAKLQLVKAKYVTQQWPVTGVFFYFYYYHVARAAVSAQHLPGSDFNLQSNMKCFFFFQIAHVDYKIISMLFMQTLEGFPCSERGQQL